MAAQQYIEDAELSKQFIKECTVHNDSRAATEYWGEELVKDIIEFVKNASP